MSATLKKILILANNDVGLYKFRKELMEELVKKNEVYISLPYGEYVPQLMELGCQFIDTSIDRRGTNPITDLKLLLKYIKIIKKVKPDVVLTYTIKPNVYGGLACRIMHIPYIVNITGLGSAVENSGLMQKVTLYMYKLAMKKANCLFFQNKENEKFFNENGIIRGNHRLIKGSGVNLKQFHMLEYPPEGKIEFVFISRIMKEKGIDQYLEAAEYIKGKYTNTRFHILGFCEEAYEDKLKLMQDKGIIEYQGMQRDIRMYLEKYHCTIHPTYYPEGMSNVLLESAASGRPIITTNRSGCRETIDEGITGFIVKSKDSNDLIKKIEKFINQPYEKKKEMGIAGRTKIEREFDRQIVVNAYLDEIETIIEI